jgi:predicted small lipoprotein YifL
VSLIRYAPKTPPVAVTVCSVVTDIPKFIEHALAELAARLHHPVQIKAGDSVFELLSKLADCGLELRLEWPPRNNADAHNEPTKPSKPTKLPQPPELNAHGVDITDEDVPF